MGDHQRIPAVDCFAILFARTRCCFDPLGNSRFVEENVSIVSCCCFRGERGAKMPRHIGGVRQVVSNMDNSNHVYDQATLDFWVPLTLEESIPQLDRGSQSSVQNRFSTQLLRRREWINTASISSPVMEVSCYQKRMRHIMRSRVLSIFVLFCSYMYLSKRRMQFNQNILDSATPSFH